MAGVLPTEPPSGLIQTQGVKPSDQLALYLLENLNVLLFASSQRRGMRSLTLAIIVRIPAKLALSR